MQSIEHLNIKKNLIRAALNFLQAIFMHQQTELVSGHWDTSVIIKAAPYQSPPEVTFYINVNAQIFVKGNNLNLLIFDKDWS